MKATIFVLFTTILFFIFLLCFFPDILDLDPGVTSSDFFLAFISGNTYLADSTPLSHRYGGHQVYDSVITFNERVTFWLQHVRSQLHCVCALRVCVCCNICVWGVHITISQYPYTAANTWTIYYWLQQIKARMLLSCRKMISLISHMTFSYSTNWHFDTTHMYMTPSSMQTCLKKIVHTWGEKWFLSWHFAVSHGGEFSKFVNFCIQQTISCSRIIPCWLRNAVAVLIHRWVSGWYFKLQASHAQLSKGALDSWSQSHEFKPCMSHVLCPWARHFPLTCSSYPSW